MRNPIEAYAIVLAYGTLTKKSLYRALEEKFEVIAMGDSGSI